MDLKFYENIKSIKINIRNFLISSINFVFMRKRDNLELDLSGLYLKTLNELDIRLNDKFTKESLVDLLIYKWVFWLECHKCGKSDYCKYTKPHHVNPDKKAEIKCGVATNFIKNYIETTFEDIKISTPEQKQAFLNTAFHLTQYIQSAEISIGTLSNFDYLSGWGNYAPSLYGFTKDTLEHLTNAHIEMKHLPTFRSKRNVILVEGHSEEIFIRNFKSRDLEIINYEGKARIDYEKIEFLVKQYQEKGYEVYLQTDKDGKITNQQLEKIKKKGLIKEENIFEFEHDFETAIPLEILYNILIDNSYIADNIDFKDFSKDIDLRYGIVKHIEKKYVIRINKRIIANEISIRLNEVSHKVNLYTDSEFLATEIGKFWNFFKRII